MFKKDYFKGWYFKCSSGENTIAFIPAYHRNGKKETASLQVITDDAVFNIPFDALKYCEKPLCIKIGDCVFSETGIYLNLETHKLTLRGELKFKQLCPIKYDIMGPFALVPFMQCRHSVYSMRHRLDGQITINGQKLNFTNGIGYIEGDRGRSFPDRYIWTQCCFENGSLMLSVADIPLFGLHFTGIIGIVILNGKEYRIATYLGAKLEKNGDNTLTVAQGNCRLSATLTHKNAHPLSAPLNGNMSRTIHESAACTAHYRFSHNGEILCEFSSNRASFEFEYI